MQRVEVIRPFRFAERGVHVIDIAAGVQELSDDAAEVALAEGWARVVVEPGVRESVTVDAQPREHKARVRVPKVK